MKNLLAQNPRATTISVVAVVLVVLGAFLWGCAMPAAKQPTAQQAAATPAVANTATMEPATPTSTTRAAAVVTATVPSTTTTQPAASNPPTVTLHPSTKPSTETYKDIPVGFTDDGLPYRGEPQAPLTMIEYSDFQCPFCSRYFVQTEPAIDEAYVRTGKVRVVFHDFPLADLHPNAPAAHAASLCVAAQGSAAQYWQMHDALFRSVSEWENLKDPSAVFARLAKDAGVNTDQYTQCVTSGQEQALVNQRVSETENLGFGGTPSFQFIRANDHETCQLIGAQPFDQFSGMIDALLAGKPCPADQQASTSQAGNNQTPFWATPEGWAPDPKHPGYNMAGDEYRGSLKAPLTVIEFTDFQCPYCRQHAEQTQPTLDKNFVDTGKTLWIVKNFPLNIHPQAPAAAVAAECAADQGKFWAMGTLLFGNQEKWSISDPTPVFVDLATQLGLNTDTFKTCLSSDAANQRVQSDMQDGAPFVRGTPTFIVLYNGKGTIIPGALPAQRFSDILQQILDGKAPS